MTSARFIVAVAMWLITGTAPAVAQDNVSRVTGHLSDPAGSGLPAVEVVLTGVDVRATYRARTDDEGRYDFPRVAPGAYRVSVRRSNLVPVVDVLIVAVGQRLTSDIGTRFMVNLGLALRAASADVLRRWLSGGPSPAAPLEWECTSNDGPCDVRPRETGAGRDGAVSAGSAVMPLLVQQPPGDFAFAFDSIAALEGRPGVVQIRGLIGEDGLPSGLIVSSATSPELALAALTAVRQMRWEPARLRDVPVTTSMTMEIRF
jgi:Carboxypeptidase regulatory-like domain/Gram-negative bacterial TonB protein C-terminal